MKKLNSDWQETVFRDKAGNTSSRNLTLFRLCWLVLTFAALSACWCAAQNLYPKASALKAFRIVAPQSDIDASTFRKVTFPIGDLGQVIRFNTSQILSRLLRQEDSYRHLTANKTHLLLLQTCLVSLLTAILYSGAFSLHTQLKPYHLQIVFGSSRHVRAGPLC